MAPASRDGRPDRNKDKGKKRPPRAERGESASGRPTGERGKPTGKPSGGKPTKGAATERFRKAHRKGAGPEGKPRSAPDAKSGQVRLNNAKPARDQNPLDAGGDGATYVKGGTRLQKVLAQSGVASRRGAEELIAAGRVEVDGEIVMEQGLRIDPETAVVRVDGARVVVNEEHQYLALNKPKGWQSTMSDEFGRPCIGDLVAERVMSGQRLFHVGRLDAETEGLILLTNDGELAHRLMHPSFEVPKTYMATVRGEVNRSLGRILREGVELDDGPAKVDKFALLDVNEGISLLRLTLHEGRKRIVRRMLDEVGHPVVRLVRTDIGSVNVGEQRPGTLRVMGNDEIGALYKAVGM